MAKEVINRGAFTIEIPEVLGNSGAYLGGDENPLEEVEKLLDEWQQNIDVLQSNVVDLAKYYDPDTIQAVILDNAFDEASAIAKNSTHRIIMMHVLEACKRSVEYDYGIYVAKLQYAIDTNLKNIVTFIPDREGKHKIDVNFSSLGDIREWANAVQATREKLKFGLKENPLMSEMWREKIYGTAREGVTISRYYKREDITRDITERYVSKYEETIKTRLKFIGARKAPFWYLLLHGNSTFGEGVEDRNGVPYPSFTGYDFIKAIGDDVVRIFKENYDSIVDKLKEEYKQFIEEQGVPDTGGDSDEDVFEYVDDKISDIDRGEILQRLGQKSIERFKVGKYVVQPYVTPTGGIGHRVFVADVSNKLKQIKNELYLK